MADRALGLDLLTRVRNIRWKVGGAIFILVGRNNVFYYKVTSQAAEPDQRKLTMPDSTLGPVVPFLSSSYKRISSEPPKPTFLVSGFVDHATDDGSTTSTVVLTSGNGLDWHETFVSDQGFDIDERGHRVLWVTVANALVWSDNDNAFFHDQRFARPAADQVNTPTGVTPWAHEQIYRSPDGEAWDGSPISDEQIWYGAETMGYRSEFPPTYCVQNNCKDTLDQNVPDGFMRDDTAKEILMRPKTPITINYGIPSFTFGESNVIEKIVPSQPVVNVSVSPLAFVDCVAGANGIWMAGGRSGAAISFDAGATWTKIPFVDDSVRSISAAPSQDIS